MTFTRIEYLTVRESDRVLRIEDPSSGSDAFSVLYQTQSGTATSGVDFQPKTVRSYHPGGADSTQTIELNIIDDSLQEGNETFYLRTIEYPDSLENIIEYRITIIDDPDDKSWITPDGVLYEFRQGSDGAYYNALTQSDLNKHADNARKLFEAQQSIADGFAKVQTAVSTIRGGDIVNVHQRYAEVAKASEGVFQFEQVSRITPVLDDISKGVTLLTTASDTVSAYYTSIARGATEDQALDSATLKAMTAAVSGLTGAVVMAGAAGVAAAVTGTLMIGAPVAAGFTIAALVGGADISYRLSEWYSGVETRIRGAYPDKFGPQINPQNLERVVQFASDAEAQDHFQIAPDVNPGFASNPEIYWELNPVTNEFRWLRDPPEGRVDEVMERLGLVDERHAKGFVMRGDEVADQNDYLSAGTGADTVFGGNSSDIILAQSGNDRAYGGSGRDVVEGGAGDDTLSGGDAADVVSGGDGDDLVLALSSRPGRVPQGYNDDIIEGGNGIDTVTYNAGSAVSGISAITIGDRAQTIILVTGDSQVGEDQLTSVERIVGTRFDDELGAFLFVKTLEGGEGDDRYIVDGADDVIIERAGEGTDTIIAGISFALRSTQDIERLVAGDWTAGITLRGNQLANKIYGAGGDDSLVGGSGNDYLAGAAGADALAGGSGNDRYLVDSAADRVTEADGGGFDTVSASADYTLPVASEVEVLRAASGLRPFLLRGNETSNILVGNDAANRLYAGAGDDTLIGGLGVDTLKGSGGRDLFVLDASAAASNLKVVLDFSSVDRILLSQDAFPRLPGSGRLTDAAFHVGAAARTGSQRILYDAGTGDLLYDGDGSGDGNAVRVASLTPGLALEASAFSVVATRAETIVGDSADDLLDGGDGTDSVFGGDGNDTLELGRSNDWGWGGSGQDTIYAALRRGPGADADAVNWIRGDEGDDTLTGDSGRDQLFGGSGNDVLVGELVGLTDAFAGDRLFGGSGDDRLEGRGGDDLLSGGAGNDRFAYRFEEGFIVPDQGGGHDLIVDFETGRDRLVLSQAPIGIVIELGAIDGDQNGVKDGVINADDRVADVVTVSHGGLQRASLVIDMEAVLGDIAGEHTLTLFGVVQLTAQDFGM